ncbi:hypothetical protein EV178_005508 [Coemansia sp. RSA 1646]|nr:hypothetical protein EV178_005508 [Coemansia sp. RSA 1646]
MTGSSSSGAAEQPVSTPRPKRKIEELETPTRRLSEPMGVYGVFLANSRALKLKPPVRLEATYQMGEYLQPNIKGIIDVASPSDVTGKSAVTRTTNSIAKLVDDLFRSRDSLANDREERSKQSIRDWLSRNSKSRMTKKLVDYLFSLFSQFQRLVPVKGKASGRRSSKGKAAENTAVKTERDMYDPVKSFVSFISQCIRLQTNLKTPPKRLIKPFEKTDVRPKDSEYDWRVDIALKCASLKDTSSSRSVPRNSAVKDPAELEDRPELDETFAYMELKRHEADMDDAYAQLFRYTKELYMAQHDRRFIWGMVMCNTTVHACIFGPNYAAASKSMKLTVSTGRKEFIRLFVNWSFCDSRKLGYDPAISYDYNLQCLVIQADSSDNKTTKTFYSREVIVCAERMFGRHTRCFKATAKEPSPPDENDTRKPHEQMDCNIFIKTAWAEAPENAAADGRDEARHLADITARLKDIASVEGMYPKLYEGCNSGRVRFTDPVSGISYEDTSKTVLGDDVWGQLVDRNTALRVHKHMYTRGIGKPIKYIKSVPEFIIVAADVMRCHWEIIGKCDILHRDISVNNMLVRRNTNGEARGMLIDFDHSIAISNTDEPVHAERTGTLQFMSISNLEKSELKPTALDDWESILYILCWVGTFGWSSKTRPDKTGSGKAPKKLHRWHQGTLEEIADAKRADLHDKKHFQNIISEFNRGLKNIDLLFGLVEKLRYVLIDEHPDKLRGALKDMDMQSNTETGMLDIVVLSDPFEERAAKWKELSESLLTVLEDSAQQTRERLRKYF